MHHILIIDSDSAALESTSKYFSMLGYEVTSTDMIGGAFQLALNPSLDCILLDLTIPTANDGYNLCKKIRSSVKTPVFFISGLSEKSFMYLAFSSGCDDYMQKPLDLRELQLRVDAIIHRYRGLNSQVHILSFPPLSINLSSRQVMLYDKPIILTNREFEILSLLAEWPGKTFSAEEIYNSVCGLSGENAAHGIQVHISHIRQKLDQAYSKHSFVQTSWGKGYLFIPPPPENI